MDMLLNSGANDVDLVQFVCANPSCLYQIDEKGNNILQMVILKSPQSLETIACLLQLHPSLTRHYNSSRCTPLHTAVSLQHFTIVDQIIHIDPDTISSNIHVGSPFQYAAQRGYLDIVKCMLAVDPKVIDQRIIYDASILHCVTNLDVALYLLKCEPTLIDTVDVLRRTPLHYQAQLKRTQQPTYPNTVQLLLHTKPSLVYMQDNNGFIALDIVNQRGDSYFVNVCFQCCPDLLYYHSGHDISGNTVLHLVANNIIDPETIACAMTHTHKCELFMRNNDNLTPLDLALHRDNEHAANAFRLHCPLDDTIASYHKHNPEDTNIDMWALEQCSVLNTFLVTDLVFLILGYLGS